LKEENTLDKIHEEKVDSDLFDLKKLQFKDILPLWSGFAPILSRELPFAIAKFLTFDVLATTAIAFLNSQNAEGSLPIQLGVGPTGLAVSALAGAFAGIGMYKYLSRTTIYSLYHLISLCLFSWSSRLASG
jgi:hypothetical protein